MPGRVIIVSSDLVIPSIILAEIKHLAAKRRFATKVADVLRVIGSAERCTIYPLDLYVVEAMPIHRSYAANAWSRARQVAA